MSIESHETVRPCVTRRLAERAWCIENGRTSGIGGNTAHVPIVDVQSGHTQELVVESVEKISTKLQVETLVELQVLSHSQVQLVAGHAAEAIATGCAGKRISTTKRVNRKRVVYDEVDIRGTDEGTTSGTWPHG